MAVEWLRIYVPMEACGSRLEKERRGDCVFDLSGQLERLLLLDLARRTVEKSEFPCRKMTRKILESSV
ncbi:hypothetical protein IHE45_02G012700 [Dioscorea alata]|uniref:Uncharacterized protein n=1 Tax=Dioscorea alata TaxID=55571 RepID=A0ACB7WP46_DIOAL|nr:hypothetical protein IHE45_02G012700 [Dioscorea alata]